ncbi:MAG: hypothetical protein C0412_15165 [Flavobacterium sp.]|nr:hypothetical protein [Flavobacterium sp.]
MSLLKKGGENYEGIGVSLAMVQGDQEESPTCYWFMHAKACHMGSQLESQVGFWSGFHPGNLSN